jgi:hypothetical protein
MAYVVAADAGNCSSDYILDEMAARRSLLYIFNRQAAKDPRSVGVY